MAREITAYLCDTIDACDSIASILADISIDAKFWSARFERLSDGRKVIGFRNILTHNSASVDHETVYETALQDVPKLKRECVEILRESEDVVKDGPEKRSGAD